MTKGGSALFQGIGGLFLSLLVWRLTHSNLGWLALFLPAAVLTLWGLYRVFVLDDV
jgi:hypothetical protein